MFMQSMHVFAIDTDLHFNTSMSIAVHVEKEGPLSIGYKIFNHATSCFLKLVI